MLGGIPVSAVAHVSGTDGAVFDAYRELIEEIASEAHDAEGPFDEHGRILVSAEALARVSKISVGSLEAHSSLPSLGPSGGQPLHNPEVRLLPLATLQVGA